MKKVEKEIWPRYFEEILKGKKKFELRLADFKVKEEDLSIFKRGFKKNFKRYPI